MSRNINFVRERRKNLSRQELDDKKVLGWAVKGIFALGVIILVIVAVRLFFSFRIRAIQAEQKETQQAIVQQEEIEKNFTVFSHKLKIVSELFGKRREKQDALKYFSNLFDSNVLITQLSYTAEEEVLSFVLQSNSIFTLDRVFEIMGSDEVKTLYPTIEKNSLRRNQNGSYGMQVTLYFGDKPVELPTPVETLEGESTEAGAETTETDSEAGTDAVEPVDEGT